MYTQCPDCHAAFHVTAEVLKQAAGKVRCGSCSHAFNALEFLSETRPPRVATLDVDAPIPELQPDSATARAGAPEPVSEEQSAALLKTLGQLAGSDVRIEDTGVEWRVLDPDDDSDFLVDQLFDTSRTPVDELLTETPTNVDAGEFFLDDTMDAPGETLFDELRFDDDTPLPEDFDVDEPPSEQHEPGRGEDAEGDSETRTQHADAAPDSDVTDEHGEWAEILDEFDFDVAPAAPPLDAELDAIEDAERHPDEAESERDGTPDDESGAATDTDREAKDDNAPNDETESNVDDANDDVAETELDGDSDGDSDGSDTRNQPLDGDESDADESGAEAAPTFPASVSEKLITDADIAPGFESIVMEGEFVSSALDNDKRAADIAAAAALAEQAQMSRDAEHVEQTFGRSRRMTTAIVVLGVLLLLQAFHQARDVLLTVPVLERVVGPVYRAIGRPVSPAWNVTGWRFEATTGHTGDGGKQLTINSRVGNKSDDSLPYPLIGITLTDRYDEPLGSSMLAPTEYLTDNLDPDARVRPGDSFNAVISVLSTTDAATGFKLKVCYRSSDTGLRCAAGGFK